MEKERKKKKIEDKEYAYDQTLTEYIVKEGIEEIGEYAFVKCVNLEKVSFCRGIRKIGRGAFSCCGKIEEIILKEGLEEIGEGAFFRCDRLKHVALVKGIRNIGNRAFAWDTSLTHFEMNEGLEKIGERIFAGCKNLKTISFPLHKINKMNMRALSNDAAAMRTAPSSSPPPLRHREDIDIDTTEEVVRSRNAAPVLSKIATHRVQTLPNIVLILNDDQDLTLGGWTPMTKTRHILKGQTAKNWFIHTPVCCPSRGELLTGRYFHNIRNKNSSGGCMHVNTSKVNTDTFGTRLGDLGYVLGYFGKHMNQAPHEPPSGWDCENCYWFANGGGSDTEPGGFLNATFSDFDGNVPVGPDEGYHHKAGTYTANTNGEYAGYTTSIIANKSIAWVERISRLRDSVTGTHPPFMLTVASKGPHIPSTPAPWYQHEFASERAPRNEAYNASSEVLADHHELIANQEPITSEQADIIDELFRDRWRTLLSIDDAIDGIHTALKDLGILNSTYFLVTSDHGYNLGQHRLPSCKLNVYDHDTRIPFLIAGPGIEEGTFEFLGSNVDVAPTILDLAGAPFEMRSDLDGRSVLPLLLAKSDSKFDRVKDGDIGIYPRSSPLREPKTWRQQHLIEYHSLGNVVRTEHLVDDTISNTYRALRFSDSHPTFSGMLYAEFTSLDDWHFENVSFYEAYNATRDPHQLENIFRTLGADERAALASEVGTLWRCAGQTGDAACP
eukprot:g1972.t1